MSDPATWTCEPWAEESSRAAAIRSQLVRQAEATDEVASRARAVAALEWDSPAGHNFSDYLVGQVAGVRLAGEQLRAAATRVGLFAVTLRTSEYDRFLGHQRS